MKNWNFIFIILYVMLLAACSSSDLENSESSANDEATNYPKKDIQGVIQWGEGGGTDITSRLIAPLVEQNLGKSLIMSNRTGASGAVGAQFVKERPSDGYTMLFASETPTMYGVLEISKLSFKDYYPINIFGRSIPVLAVKADSPYQTFDDVIAASKENPGKLKFSSPGPGTMGHVISSMISLENDVKFNSIPYEGNGPSLVALLGGHVDFTIVSYNEANEYRKSGDARILTVFDTERIEGLDVPTVVELDENYKKHLPWGSFYGAWVNRDTPQPIIDKLIAAFKEAHGKEEFQSYLEQIGVIPMGISGAEADEFLEKFASTTAWILYEAGEVSVSPESLGISKPE